MPVQSADPAPIAAWPVIVVGLFVSARQFSFKFGSTELLKSSAEWPSIFSRFTVGNPSYVVRSVRTIWIDPIQHMVRRTLAYISQKIREAIPTFAYGDAATAVNMIPSCFLIITSKTHIFPNTVKWMLFFIASSIAMFEPLFASFTSARFSMSDFKLNSVYNAQFSTVTLAQPKYVSSFCGSSGSSSGNSNDSQSTKALICDIDEFGHRTAPSVRMSSSGVSVCALTPLRFVAD